MILPAPVEVPALVLEEREPPVKELITAPELDERYREPPVTAPEPDERCREPPVTDVITAPELLGLSGSYKLPLTLSADRIEFEVEE